MNIGSSSTDVYFLNNSIDCSGISNFIPVSAFQARLEGMGYTIYNLTINNNTIYTAMINQAKNCVVNNLNFIDANITSSVGYIGVLFGKASNCNLNNVTIGSSSPSKRSYVNAIGSTNYYVGGLVGSAEDACKITGCKVSNTIIKTKSDGNTNGFSSVGGLIGQLINGTVDQSYNLGTSDPNEVIVDGYETVGSLVASTVNSTVTRSGAFSGIVNSTSNNGLIGFVQNSNISQVFSESLVSYVSNGFNIGLFGKIDMIGNGYFSIDNCYSRSNVSFNYDSIGGLVGLINITGNSSLDFFNIYVSNYVSGSGSNKGAVFGQILKPGTGIYSFSNIYYDKSLNNGLNVSGSAILTSSNSTIIGYNCSQLYSTVTNISLFDQSTIWSGNNLRNVYNSTFGSCNCLSGCPTSVPTTFTPSSLIPSTKFPSSYFPSTLNPSILTPSTLIPTTIIPSTLTPSTNIPSTITPPISCIYNVLNCEKCTQNVILTNTFGMNISCEQVNGVFQWIFKNSTSDTITISQTFTINNTNINMFGNLTIETSSTVEFVISEQKQSTLSVSGCVSINGSVVFVVDKQFKQGNTSVTVLKYNCTESLRTLSTQYSVKPTYLKNNCDELNFSLNNAQGTLSVVFNSNNNSKCKKSNKPLIIGLSIGIPLATAIIVVGVILIFKFFVQNQAKSNVENFNKSQYEMNNK